MQTFRTLMQLRRLSAVAQNTNVLAIPKGRYQHWKKPVYCAPHVHPLEVGPDFSVIEGRTVHVTSRKQLEYKLNQIRLAKKVVQLLEEVKQMEAAHAKAEAERLSELQRASLLRPKPKGTKSIDC